MASDSGSAYPAFPNKTHAVMHTTAEMVAYVRKELDIDQEHLARVISNNNGELPHDAHSGVTLDLSHKNIHELPVEVVALIKDRVERLALSHNPSIAVPREIVRCDRLRYLNLRWNGLRQFPEAILQLTKLEILDISKNKIVAIPEDIKRMSSLKFLAVARNKITRLPLAIGEMATLSKFKFDENPIEFPPPDVLRPQSARGGGAQGLEQEKDVCQQVKRFLRQAALRERLMSHSEDDVRYASKETKLEQRRMLIRPSESSAETPRPPRRTLGGRFPVRPSISGIEGVSELRLGSPDDNAPPIPARSHARVASQTLGFQLKRPGIAPLLIGTDDISRSRSETLSSSASLRARRQGFVPSKRVISNQTPDNSNNVEVASQVSSRSSQATIKASHSRNTSIASTYQGLLAANSSGETSSSAVSPVDGPPNRYGPTQRVGNSLMQHPNIKLLKTRPIIAARRLLFVLLELHRPLTRIAIGLKEGTQKRSILEKQLFAASTQLEEIDRLLNRLDSGYEDTPKRETAANKNIAIACDDALKAFGMVVKEMKGCMMKIVHVLDPVLVRNLMFQVYTTMNEARNICKLLGFQLALPSASPASVASPRRSRPWSSRTVTPTQPKPPASRRLRGATILRSTSSNATLRAMPPPVPLNGNTSRTNTMTSTTAATPRSGESFASAYSSVLPSRSNTLRSQHTTAEDSDEGDQFERIFLKLRQACDLAGQALPRCHTEFTLHKDNAESAGKHRDSHCWSLALSKCNGVIRANRELQARLKQVRLKDPGVRNQKDFWQLCDTFVQVDHFSRASASVLS